MSPLTSGALAAVPQLLRSDPALPKVLGAADATVAVAASAQPIMLAALANFTERSPLLVVTATEVEAVRMADDLACFLATDERDDAVVGAVGGPVVALPAWETLPFERVSPEVETMGRRLAILWGLTHTDLGSVGPSAPRVIVAPIRALLQRLGPFRDATAPVLVRPGQELAAEELLARLVAMGYRREHQVEHRGEIAVRGGIIDVFPSTSDVPVRIDMFGDEVDRLTAFAVADQRSSYDLEAAVLFGCREVVATAAVQATARSLLATEPWGATHWERLSQGELFDGMESWLPYVHPSAELLPDLLAPGSQVVLVEPRKIRDRPSDSSTRKQPSRRRWPRPGVRATGRVRVFRGCTCPSSASWSDVRPESSPCPQPLRVRARPP